VGRPAGIEAQWLCQSGGFESAKSRSKESWECGAAVDEVFEVLCGVEEAAGADDVAPATNQQKMEGDHNRHGHAFTMPETRDAIGGEHDCGDVCAVVHDFGGEGTGPVVHASTSYSFPTI
jgi:hypothetical protein